MKKVIFNLIIEHHGNWSKVYDAILNKEKPKFILDLDEWKQIYENSIFISENNYFDKFKKMYMPPFALFYNGNIELLNQKVFGVFGNIQDMDLENLKELKNNDYVICLLQEETNENLIKKMLDENFKLIILCEQKINYSININNQNIVFVSEYCTNEINIDNQQLIKRLMYAISDDIFIKSITNENVDIVLENYQNEIKRCFLILDEDLSNNIYEKLDKKIFNHIHYLNEIIDFNKKN